MTHLSPASEALDNTSVHSEMVVGLKVEIEVSVCLLSEHRSEDSGALSLHLNIQKGNPVVELLFYSELNGRELVVEAVMECTRAVVLVRPDCKYIIHVSLPLTLVCMGIRLGLFKGFHVQIGNNQGKWGTHCCSLYLSIEMFSKLKVGDLKTELDEGTEVLYSNEPIQYHYIILYNVIYFMLYCDLHYICVTMGNGDLGKIEQNESSAALHLLYLHASEFVT